MNRRLSTLLLLLVALLLIGSVFEVESRRSSTPATTNRVLPPGLIVSILSVIPAGPSNVRLYESVGAKIGEIAWNQVGQNVKMQLIQRIGLRTGRAVGRKFAMCFAETGFLLQKRENILTKVTGGIAARRARAAALQQANALITEMRIQQTYGRDLADFLREAAAELGPMIGRKVVQCLFGPDKPSYNPPAEFRIQNLLAVLPTGRQYDRAYSAFGERVGEELGKIVASKVPADFLSQGEAIEVGSELGREIGHCIAVYGWQVEKKSNWLMDLFQPVFDEAPALIASQLGPQVDNIFKQVPQIAPLKTELKPHIIGFMQQVGPVLTKRLLQCLLLPMDDFGRNYGTDSVEGFEADVDEAEVDSAESDADVDSAESEADVDSAPATPVKTEEKQEKSRPHPRMRRPRGPKVSVDVNVKA